MNGNLPSIISDLPVVPALEESSLQSYVRRVNMITSLTQEEEFMLAKDYLEKENLEAAHRLITSHLKLVVKIALSFRNYKLPVIELISEGNLGLIHAIKKYDPDLGFRLSTYAMWWIKATIQEYILKSWSLVKIGTTANQKKLFFSLKKIKHKLTTLHSREVGFQDYEYIANELGISMKEVIEVDQRLSQGDLSLNQPLVRDDQNDELINFIPESKASVELLLGNEQEAKIKKLLLKEAMATLNPREVEILTCRRLREVPVTLDVLSKKFDLSKERIRQLENRAVAKLQEYVLKKINQDCSLLPPS